MPDIGCHQPAGPQHQLENLIRLHAAGSGISDSEVLGKMIREQEEDRPSLKAKLSSLERQVALRHF
jgi:hypothetical protein